MNAPISSRRSLSLRSRLLAGGAVIALVLVAVSGAITVLTRRQLVDQVDARLTTLSPERRGPLGGRGDRPGPMRGDGDRISDAYVGVLLADGQLVALLEPNAGDRDDGFVPPAFGPGDVRDGDSWFATVDDAAGRTTYRIYAQRLGEATLVTALPLDDVQRTITRLVTVEVAGTVSILAVLTVVGWWMLRLGIRPVRNMTAAAARIAEGDLSVRAPERAVGTEAGDLAVAINRMLEQISTAFAERTEADARLRRFVADASHELRTPITTIRGYAELYRHGGLHERSDLDDAMRRTEQEAARMGRLVEDMLTLAKFDEQRPLARREVDVVAVCRDSVADARVTQPERLISLVSGIDRALVSGDEDRLRQAIGNVVTNALVHTPVEVPVTVAVTEQGDRVEIAVSDRGAGMDPETAARVTERFFRADPARARDRGGSGLGLAITAAAVEAHGGSVRVDSMLGAGTTVRVTLPVTAWA